MRLTGLEKICCSSYYYWERNKKLKFGPLFQSNVGTGLLQGVPLFQLKLLQREMSYIN